MKSLNRKLSVALLFVICIFCFSADCKINPAKGGINTKDVMDLKIALKSGVPVVVKLGADYCYPCRLMKPTLKQLAIEQNGKAI